MKGVQCYELFGGIALKIHTFSFFHFKVPIAVDGRQFIHAPEFGCVAEERHASRSWSSKGLKAAEIEMRIAKDTLWNRK